MGRKVITYQEGPQERFAACEADICVFGGQNGGGKTGAIVLEASKWTHLPNYGGIIFRRTYDDLIGAGSLWELIGKWYPHMGARLKESPGLTALWPNGAGVYLQHLHPIDKEVLSHDGKQYCFIGVDEGQYLTEFEFWFIWGRARDPNARMRAYMRITCNPDPDCYLRTLLDWWIGEDGFPIPERDGVLRWCIRPEDKLVWFDSKEECQAFIDQHDKDLGEPSGMRPISVTFIRATLDDNKVQGEEWIQEYRGKLALLDRATRAKKMLGNWNAPPESGSMFDRTWFRIMDSIPPESQIAYKVRSWDKAASKPTKKYPDPDWTRGTLLYLLKNGDVVIGDIVSARDTPGAIDALVYQTAQMDGADVEQAFWIDPGQAGIVDEEHTKKLFAGLIQMEGGKLKALGNVLSFVKEGKNKVHYAKPWSAYADPDTALGRFWIVRGQWNGVFLSEIEKFPRPKGKEGEAIKDDIVDSISRGWIEIEKKKKSGKAHKFKKAMNAAKRQSLGLSKL